MPKKKKHTDLDRVPHHDTIAFHLGISLKDFINEKAYFEKLSNSDCIALIIRNMLQYIKDYEPLFLRVRYGLNKFTSMRANMLSKREHQYIYTLVEEFKFFQSRSELLRFALMVEMLLLAVDKKKQPRTLPLFDYNDLFDEEKVEKAEKQYNLFTSKMEKMRKLYPNMPEYKAMNEE